MGGSSSKPEETPQTGPVVVVLAAQSHLDFFMIP